MSENNTSTETTETSNETKETLGQLARNLIAEHPWFVGLGTAAVGAALSHWYYGNKALTTAAWGFAAAVGGVALSKIAQHAREIEIAAQAAIALPEEVAAIGGYLTSQLGHQTEMIMALQAENRELKEALLAEVSEAKKHREWSVAQTAEAKVFAQKATEDCAKAVALAQQAVPAAPAETPAAPAAEPKPEAKGKPKAA